MSEQPNEFFKGGSRYRPPSSTGTVLLHGRAYADDGQLDSAGQQLRPAIASGDGMRSIDYLVSRPEIDASRIGCTGNSGGGTLTSYIMALDERVQAAAPVCYSTMYRYLIDFNGPQDGEQNIFGQLAYGMDIADYTLMRGSQADAESVPAHMTRRSKSTVRGNCSAKPKRFYTRMGYAERVDIIEADAPHGFTIKLREGSARWMNRWLLHKENAIFEGDLPVFTDEELQCSQSGQILLDAGERSLFEINDGLNQQLAKERAELWGSGDLDTLRDQVREVSGIKRLEKTAPPNI